MTGQLLHEGICRRPGCDLLKTDGLYVVEKIDEGRRRGTSRGVASEMARVCEPALDIII